VFNLGENYELSILDSCW